MHISAHHTGNTFISPGALDFEMEKKTRKLIFSGKLLEGAQSPKPMILYHSLCRLFFFVIQDGVRRPSWICGISRFRPMYHRNLCNTSNPTNFRGKSPFLVLKLCLGSS